MSFLAKQSGWLAKYLREIYNLSRILFFSFIIFTLSIFCLAIMVSLSLKQRLLTLRELIANETNSSLLLLQLDHIISNLGGLSKNEKDEVICQMQEKLRIQENKCQALKKSLKLSETSLEKLRYDLEGSSAKSQNLEKDLKELRQKIFKEKMM